MSLCQPEKNISCGGCCGLLNLELKVDEYRNLLQERTREFQEIVNFQIRHTIPEYRQKREKKELEISRKDETIYNCPFLGYIGERVSRIGCMIHPAAASSDITLYPAGMEFVKLVYGKERSWEPQNENVAKYWQHKYPWEALIPMMTLVDYSSTFPYESMETPVLFLYSDKDNIVDLQKIKDVHSIYKSSKKKILEVKEADGHVMAGDFFSPKSTEIVKEIQ